jgi:hypothetical protein
MGPQDPKYVTRDLARDLSGLVGEFAALKGDANHWLEGSEYDTLKHRLEDVYAAVEKVRELLPSGRTLPLKIVTVVVEDLFAIVRREAS